MLRRFFMLFRITRHTIRERTGGDFHFRTVDEDSLIEIINLLLQFDRMMVSVSFGSKYRFMFSLVSTEYQQICYIQKLQIEQYIFCLLRGKTATGYEEPQ